MSHYFGMKEAWHPLGQAAEVSQCFLVSLTPDISQGILFLRSVKVSWWPWWAFPGSLTCLLLGDTSSPEVDTPHSEDKRYQ